MVWWAYISPSCFGPHSLHTWMYLLQFDSCPCFGGVQKVNCTWLFFLLPTSLPFYQKEKKQCKSIGNLCPRWDIYIANDVEDPKFIILYPKGFIHSFIHSSKFNTICNCTIQYLPKEQAISFLFIHYPKKLNTNLQSHIFLIWLFMQRTSQGISSYSSIHDRQLNNIHNLAFWSFLWEEVVKWSIIPIDEWMNE